MKITRCCSCPVDPDSLWGLSGMCPDCFEYCDLIDDEQKIKLIRIELPEKANDHE